MIPLPLEKGGREGFWQKQFLNSNKRRNRHGKEENVVRNGGRVVLFDVCCCFG
jgi:hypothetical protein